MRSISLPGARPASRAATALCLVPGLVLAACSSATTPAAKPSAHRSHSAAASPSAPAQPATGPAAQAAVKSTWETFFNGNVAIPSRIGLLEDGPQFASFVNSQAKTSLGALVLQASAKVSSVVLVPPDQATVTYTILLGGKPLAKNLTGTAVYAGGAWKISKTTFCALLHVAYSSKAKLIPAVCGS